METEKIDVPKFDGFEAFYADPENEKDVWVLDNDGKKLCWYVGYGRGYQICYRKIKPKRIVFEEVGNERSVLEGDFYKGRDGQILRAYSVLVLSEPVTICRRVEEQS